MPYSLILIHFWRMGWFYSLKRTCIINSNIASIFLIQPFWNIKIPLKSTIGSCKVWNTFRIWEKLYYWDILIYWLVELSMKDFRRQKNIYNFVYDHLLTVNILFHFKIKKELTNTLVVFMVNFYTFDKL